MQITWEFCVTSKGRRDKQNSASKASSLQILNGNPAGTDSPLGRSESRLDPVFEGEKDWTKRGSANIRQEGELNVRRITEQEYSNKGYLS